MSQSTSDVLKHLIRTEKATVQTAQGKYFFMVDRQATKPEIRRAVEQTFKVKVKAVHTTIMPGKPRRLRVRWGWKPNWKKAMVTLAEGSKIEVAI